ncbi:unnamed protein product [Lepidochelys kempii]
MGRHWDLGINGHLVCQQHSSCGHSESKGEQDKAEAVVGKSQRWEGTLKVAEVASRFGDIRAFVSAVTQLGFQIVSKDLGNPFFYMFDFSKTGQPRAGGSLPGLALRPCLYKKR